MAKRDRFSDLPVEHREGDLEDLEPHQQTIERFAKAYYGACDRVARAIRAVKSRLGSSDDD